MNKYRNQARRETLYSTPVQSVWQRIKKAIKNSSQFHSSKIPNKENEVEDILFAGKPDAKERKCKLGPKDAEYESEG